MITVAIALCENSAEGRHEAGRALLAAMTAPLITEPADGEIITLAGGKPVPKSGRYGFSVSHSGGFVCCAVATHEPLTFTDAPLVFSVDGNADLNVGADIEVLRDRTPKTRKGIMNRFFSPKEREFTGCDLARFFETHTRKEALCKLSGEGLSGYKKASSLSPAGAKIDTRRIDVFEKQLVLSVAFYESDTKKA